MLPTLVIGDFRRKEYAGPARWRMRHGAETAANVEAALERIDGGCTPAVILVLQERPGSVADRQIAMLRRKAPLARIGVLLGSWSEGETRTGQPLPGVRRIFWHQWPAVDAALQDNAQLEQDFWSLPDTTTDDERLLAWDAARRGRQANACAHLAIVANHLHTSAALAEICQHLGWTWNWSPKNRPLGSRADIVLFDAAHNAPEERLRLEALLQASGTGLPTLVLAGFPRVEDVDRWTAAGATAVVSKPFLAASLADSLQRLLVAGRKVDTASPACQTAAGFPDCAE